MKTLPSLAALLPLLLACSPLLAQTDSAGHRTYHLKPTPKTVTWGYYSASAPPALRIHSGDSVEIQTLLTSSPKRLAAAGVPANEIEQSLRDIFDQVKDRGPGGHILTGPVYVEGAEPGDVLEVRIEAIRLAIPYAYNGFAPGKGFLPDDYPYGSRSFRWTPDAWWRTSPRESTFRCTRSSAAWVMLLRKPPEGSAAVRPGCTRAISTTNGS